MLLLEQENICSDVAWAIARKQADILLAIQPNLVSFHQKHIKLFSKPFDIVGFIRLEDDKFQLLLTWEDLKYGRWDIGKKLYKLVKKHKKTKGCATCEKYGLHLGEPEGDEGDEEGDDEGDKKE